MIVIGKFKELYKDDALPSIKNYITAEPYPEKEMILSYLKNAQKGAYSPAKIIDVITGDDIPGGLCCYADGIYAWRSDIIYYVDKYNLRLDNEFLKHIQKAAQR